MSSSSSSSSIWRRELNSTNREIRLLEIEPSKNINSLPQGRLVVRSLSSHPTFDAISHSWGFPQDSVLMQLGPPGTYWPITINLSSAIRYLRGTTEPRAFWLDALCINPFDPEERSQQIALLRDIFHAAQAVQVWMGPITPAILDATTSIKLFAMDLKDPNTSGQAFKSTKLAFDKIRPFLECDWWQRLWVKQEVALARRVVFHSNHVTTSLEDLSGAQKVLSKLLAVSTKMTIEVEGLSRAEQRLSHFSDLMDLKSAELESPRFKIMKLVRVLQACRQARVSDPKDRVYAFLGICAQLFDKELKNGQLMKATYDEVVFVYTMFAYKLIDVSGSLFLFNQVSAIHNSITALPSWVPDWTSFYSHNTRMLFESPLKFHAADIRPRDRSEAAPLFKPSRRSARIGLTGHIIGHVRGIDSFFQPDESELVSHQSLSDTVSRWQHYYLGEQSRIQDRAPADCKRGPFASVILGGCQDIGSSDYDSREDEQMLKALLDNSSPAEKKLVNTVYHVVKNTRFFLCAITGDSASPGLGPPDTRVGDVIAILEGGSTAYILRHQEDDKEALLYSFVGECFIHGVMRGERVPQRNPVIIWLQ